MLRLTGSDNNTDDRLRPIPFPQHRAHGRDDQQQGPSRRRTPGRDTGWMAEKAVEQVQSHLDELDELLNDPLLFPGVEDDDDGPPSAA